MIFIDRPGEKGRERERDGAGKKRHMIRTFSFVLTRWILGMEGHDVKLLHHLPCGCRILAVSALSVVDHYLAFSPLAPSLAALCSIYPLFKWNATLLTDPFKRTTPHYNSKSQRRAKRSQSLACPALICLTLCLVVVVAVLIVILVVVEGAFMCA